MKWMDATIFVFDTETTGVKPDVDEVVQLTVIRYDVGRTWAEMSGFTQMFKPRKPIPAGEQLFCGITAEELEDKPYFSDCINEVVDVFRPGMVFAAYNASFDVRMLRAELQRAKTRRTLPMTRKNTIDPLAFSRGLYPSVRGHKLAQVSARLGVRLDVAHDATHDSLAAGEVLVRLAVQHNLPPDLEGMITLQEQYVAKWSQMTGYPVEEW